MMLLSYQSYLEHVGNVERNVQNVDGCPANEEDKADSNQDVVGPPPSGHLPYGTVVGSFAVGLTDWD